MTARMPLIKNLNKNPQILHTVCGVAHVRQLQRQLLIISIPADEMTFLHILPNGLSWYLEIHLIL